MPPPSSDGGHGGGGHKKEDESLMMEGPSTPSPKSEAIANDLQELTLQPGCEMLAAAFRPQSPPLSERKNVLQLKLQQRRTREELVNQGIMPPLKSPASFHEQRKSLERARTEDYLKRKIRCRPERSELVRMHILEETSAEPSLQAKQLKLKRARLADDLNEKISQRPGPMELVVKNIIPVETSLKEALIDVDYPKVADSSSFDEDSSDALSPEQPASQDSQGSVPSPADYKPSDVVPLLSPTQTLFRVQLGSERAEKNIPSELSQSTNLNISNGFSVTVNKSFSAVIKQNHSKQCHDKFRAKKLKDTKPKVKKLKYHQYIPPDQKQKGSLAMDSSYAKILQQQQLFLQLQILNQQQQQHYNYQTILPAPPKLVHTDLQATAVTTTTAVRTLPTVSISTHCAPIGFKQNSSMPPTATKTGPLPTNLDDMKVAELKQELKQRGLHVSGTKVDLLERLKATQDLGTVHLKPAPVQQPKPCEVIPVTPNIYAPQSVTDPVSLGSFSSTPPCSPCPSEVSVASADDMITTGDSSAETVSSPLTQLLLLPSPVPVMEKSSTDVRDKDIMLREKDRQIEELTRRLKQKQELVERLKQQLEQEKRTQQSQPSNDHQTSILQVKQEIGQATCDSSRCMDTSNPKATVKREPSSLQKPHNFINSSKKNAVKINGSSEAQVVFAVNKPSALQAENKKSVIPQNSRSAIQLNPCTTLSNAIPPNMEAFSDMKQSDFREEAPLCCSPKSEGQPTRMQTDDFLDNFIHNLELATKSKESYMPSMKQTSPTPVVNEVPQSELHQLLAPTTPDRLEDFLEASTGTKILHGDGDEDGAMALTLIDELHSQMLSSLAILDHPTSSMDTSDLHFSPEGGPLGLDISGSHLDSMDWLELSEPPAMNLTPLSTATPSVFSTEFLDSHDLQLQWDSCL
ncbi:myocardin-related transcription factor A isoform X2 [Hyla sarda]|uniref:myocardin-related transcription factor A isoform X2 n=1 Tax=Hyla sarda TaxID=327740 RepID=UPI0024C25855|nr:myocardin-related transcription factor A isoform X2 [Hyla sarda]